MRRILLLISFILSGFVASAQSEYISDAYHPFLTAPQKVCAGAYASMHAWLQDVDDSDHDKHAVDSVRWTIDMPVSPNFVYSQPRGASSLVRWIANNSESITFNVTEIGTYTVTARVYFKIWQSGSWRAKYVDVTKTFISEDCTMDKCEGTWSPATDFKETFGTFTVNENPRALGPPATIDYIFDGDGELKDNYYSIHYSARIGGKNEWGDVFDHTNDGYGGMLIANSSEQPRLFYSRTVNGLCPGAKYNFSAWFINLNSLGVINSVCESWNGSYQYAGVTFIVRNADNNAIIGQFNTNDVSMDLSRENGGDQRMTGWQQFGGTVTLGPGVTDVIVEIRNNNPGGCGNDIAVDDIEFAFCAPKIYSYIDGLGVTNDDVCPGAELTLTSVIQPADYFTNPVYRWEYSKNGAPYETITEAGYTGVNTPTLNIGPGVLQEGDLIKYQLMVIEAGNLAADDRQCYTPSNFVTLNVLELPTINATRDVLCRGDSTILTASPLEAPGVRGYETFTWTGPDILPWPATEIQPKNQILIRPQVTSEYSVIGTITYGQHENGQPRVCFKKDSLVITVDQPPVVELGPDVLTCVNSPITLDAGADNAGYDITWQPGNLHTQAINITAPSTPATQEYKVNIQNGQCTVRDSVKITSVQVTNAVINGITEYCTDVMPAIKLKPDIAPDPGATPPQIVTWSFVGDNHGATLVTTNPTGAPNNRQLQNMPFNIPVTVRMTIEVSGTDCISTDEKTFIVETQPNAAARSLAQCSNVFTLDADPVKDTSMTGTWSVISGDVTIDPAEIHNPNAPATINNGPQNAVLRWTVVKNRPGSACPPQHVDITLSYVEPATISVAPATEICRDGFGYFVLPWTSTNDPEQYDLEAVGPNPMPGFMDVIDEPIYATDGDFYIFYPADAAAGSYTFRIRAEKMTMTGDICFTESLFTLTINTPSVAPTISLPTPSICAGSSATLTINGGTLGSNMEWVWYSGNCATGTEIARGVTSITVSPTATTTYSVRAEGTTGPTACGNSSCVSSTVTVYQMPADAVAGPDQENCDNTTFIMNADAPSISGAQGTWTASPAGVTISDIHNRNATVTVPAGITATLTWTVTNGPCVSTADDVILINRNPIANNAIQQDQVLCPPNTTPAELTGTAAVTGGTGVYTYQWQSSSSATGTFTDIGGATGANYQPGALTATTYYRRTVTSGACTSNSNVIEVKVAAVPNYTITDLVSACNASGKFEVQYAIISGAPNRYDLLAIPGYELPGFTDLFNQSLSGGQITISYPPSTSAGEYRFRIVMRNADGCEKADTVTTTLESLSLPAWIETTPSRICEGSTVTLTAKGGTLGSNADWVWYKDNCGVGTPIGTGTSITFQPTETTTFAVRAESNRACKNTDCATATVTVDKMPAAANGGQDQEHCDNATFIMDATVPDIGTGTWTGLTPDMTISDPHDPKATVTLPAGQTVTLTWTITNNTCTTAGDNVVLINRNAIGDNVIQSDQVICPNTQPSQLTGVGAPSGGSGAYTYEWEYSTTDATTGFVTVPSATGSIFQPPVLTQTTWYRRIVRSGTECESISNVVEITVSTVPPSVTSTPPPVSAACFNGTDYTTLFGTPTFNHPLGLTLNITHRDSTAAQTCGFTITRIWTATDPCGKTATTQQTITVTDNTAPVFATAAPGDVTVECGNIPSFDDIAVTDECSTVLYEKAEKNEPIAGACVNSYQIVRTWTATDACGNKAVLTQTITVIDTKAPVFTGTLPVDITVECDNVPAQEDLTANDACGGAVTIVKNQTRVDSTCGNLYRLVRTWTATDVCGNDTVLTQMVFVRDTKAPVFTGTLPVDITVECDNVPAQEDLTANDACGGAVTIVKNQTRVDSTCGNLYRLVRTWTATDVCGNDTVLTQMVFVRDTKAPVFTGTLPVDITVECDNVPAQEDLTANDACGGAVTIVKNQTRVDSTCGNLYRLVRTWTATDVCGNDTVLTQMVFVRDTKAPVFTGTLPVDITVECDNVPAQEDLTANDACGGAVTIVKNQTRVDSTCGNLYRLVRTWTATDVCGNDTVLTQMVFVRDTKAPVFTGTLPVDITVECDNVPAQEDLTANDACDGAVTIVKNQTRVDSTCGNLYRLVRTWTATDVCGNDTVLTQMVFVRDTKAPVFTGTLPVDITVECDNVPAQEDLTANDACGGAVTIVKNQTRVDSTCGNLYRLVRTWTATDVCGNDTVLTQMVFVRDTKAPVFTGTLPVDITVECDNVPAQEDLTANDACGGAVTIVKNQTRVDSTCGNLYRLVRTWTATDVCGNDTVLTQMVFVRDTKAPVFTGTLPVDITVECDNVPAQEDLTANDACGGAVTIVKNQTRVDSTCGNLYRLVRTWTATDVCGNDTVLTQMVFVRDTKAPVFTGTLPVDITVECDNVPAQEDLTANDACGGAVTIVKNQTRVDSTCGNLYRLVRTWTATDVCGNDTVLTQMVFVRDTKAPVFTGTLPVDITVECDNIPAQEDLTANDACGGAVTIVKNQTRVDSTCGNLYRLVRTWTATDVCGNDTVLTQMVFVRDTKAPVFTGTLPVDITVECDNVPAQEDLTANDACGGAVTIVKNQTRVDSTCGNLYRLVRTWTATDVCGNDTVLTQMVFVRDTKAPVFTGTLPVDVTVECDNVPAQEDLTANDACGGAVTIVKNQTRVDSTCGNLYRLVRTWTATDVCGNDTVLTQMVFVRDTKAPVFTGTLPVDITVECDNVPAQEDLTANDACGGAVTIVKNQTRVDSTCGNLYRLVRTWTATDVCGNDTVLTQMVFVRDTKAPVFTGTLPVDITVECDNVPAQEDLTANDACGGAVTIVKNQTRVDSTCGNLYRLVRTWTATDVCGNDTVLTQMVFVRDTKAPVFTGTLPVDITVECDNVPAQEDLTANDACGGAVTIVKNQTRVDSTCGNLYRLVRTWTATDVCGNDTVLTQMVFVRDTKAPVFTGTLPVDITVECDNVPAQEDLTANDACGGAVTIVKNQTRVDSTCGNLYRLVRTWTATDVCGNDTVLTQMVFVRDTKAPVFTGTLPVDITVECDNVPAQEDLTANDACGGAVTIVKNQTRVDSTCGNLYRLVRTWTATDVCGNDTVLTQMVFVRDTKAPVFTGTLPVDITVECDNIPAQEDLTANDACGGAVTIVKNQTRVDSTCGNLYRLVRTWTATDVCGNDTVLTQMVFVRDTKAPVFTGTLPVDITVECDNVPAQEDLTANDACGGAVTIVKNQTRVDSTCGNLYRLVRTWTATDVCGNDTVLTQMVFVRDTKAPVFTGTLPVDVTVECDNVPAQEDLTANDACGGAVTIVKNQTRVDSTCGNLYRLVRTWTATDVCGNDTVLTQMVFVRDTKAPVFTGTLPVDITVECDNVPAQEDLTANDACGGAVTIVKNQTRVDSTCGNLYRLVRTWTATDVCGNDTVLTQMVFVRDTKAPVFTGTLPVDITVECDNVPAQEDLTANDACGGAVTIVKNQTRVDSTCGNLYRLVRTWTATDVCGNDTVLTQMVFVRDTKAPVFTGTLPVDITVECDNVPAQEDLTANDACGGAVTIVKNQTRVDSTCGNLYRLVRTWTATDVCGNSAVLTQMVFVQDTKPPTFTTSAPANATVECSAIPDQIDLQATDLCSPAGTVRVLENQIRQNIPGACANNYLLIRTWTALDACNNATTVTQTLTVVDRTAPVFTSTIPANTTVECDNIPGVPDMTARDNCSATNKVTISYNQTRENIPGACVNNYRLRRTWTATDECGNFTTAVQIITVQDTKPPVFTAAAPANITVECDAVPDQPDMTATDNCSGIVNITKAQQRFDSTCANTYRLVRTWTATDVCGNSTTLTQTIIVADRTKPVFSTIVPRDTIVNCDAIPTAPVMRANDNCAPVVNITYDEQHVDIPGACTNNYKLLRTWTANDGCGNITRVIQVITVQDTTKPVFTLPIPANATVNCDAIPAQPDLTASDNCSPAAGVTVTKAERRENITGACVNNYRLIRTWTARDVCGNTAVATQIITVQDTTRPVFTLPVPVNVTVECNAIPAMPDLTATDNCSAASRVTITKAERTEPIPGACANNYRLIRTWTAKDECGNSTAVTQVITVTDTTAPAFTMPVPADATVDCNNIPAQPQLTATDNCSATNRITVTRAQRREDIPGACVNNYRLIRTWTATDECGNTRTVSQTITVQDTTRPAFTVSVPMDATVECSAIPVMPDLNVTDNCTPSDRVTVVKAERREDIPGACANNYRLIRTWTATDECGNSHMVQQVLTVTDRTAPTFTISTPANAIVECDAIPVQPDLSATDNCSMANSVSIVKAERRENIPGACANNYRLIRTWTATDECGNSRTVEQMLTVVDRTPPVFTTSVPANITAECDAIPAMPDLTATDNCSPMNVTIVKNEVRENIPGACVNNYRLIRTWTASDECGNTTVMKQTVTVEDRTAPVFTLQPPTNITVNCDEVPAAPVMTATDNCSGNNVTVRYSFTKRQLSGECINNYRLTRTWVATDECGNSATATQVITVIDTTRPVFNMAAPADTTVSCDAIPSPVSISASDNCSLPGAVSVTFNQVRENIPGACASNYRLIYTWTAVDECGNTAVMRQVVTVQDTTRPVIDTPPADITLSCGQGIPTDMIELNATDNCDGSFPKKVKYTIDPYTPDLCNGYTITRRWSVTDECGNAAQDVVQRIIVLPCPKPELQADVFTNCSSMPFITLKTNGHVNRPVYTLVGVTPANAVPVPVTSGNPMFNVNGATTASFVVRDGLTGCVSDTMTYTINYLDMPVVNLGADTSLCGGNGMVLDAGPANFGYNISWSTGETTQRIRVTQAGTYKVTVSNGMCTATDSIVVSVIPMPLIDLPDTTICRGQSVTLDATVEGASSYFWNTGANTPSINVSTQERFWVQVIKNGCITIDTIDVTVNPPPDITLSRDTTICPGQTVMLTVNTSAGRIMWGTGEEGSSILVSRAGTYSVAVYRDNCVVRESVRVAERPNMEFDLGPDRIMCPGGSIIVDARHPDAATYRWNDGDLSPVKSISMDGVYKLGILDRFCDRYQEDSIKVTIAGPPTLNLGNDTIICKGRRHILKANAVNATAYQWSTGATTSYIEVSEPGTYSVTVFNDCGSATDEITIDVKECDSKPEMPNAFSPNGDGKNDVFRPQVRGPMYDYELRVFNRWGELVYLSKDQYEGWDGTYKGRPVDIGTFVWWLTYKKVTNGPAFIIKGDVTVVR